MFVDSHL